MKNNFRTFILFPLFLFANITYAQSVFTPAGTTDLFKINFWNPGISYEKSIDLDHTLRLSSYIAFLTSDPIESPNGIRHIFFTPSLNAEFRTYYNLQQRNDKGRRTAMNSANYFAPLYIGRYSTTGLWEEYKWINQFGFVWGMQRTAPRGFSIDFHAGIVVTPGANNTFYYYPVDLLFQLSLGYNIAKK
ncbi:MAG TPA: hypothetical protein VFV79_03200 [Saprospiraceae bacterium]|nr:hypothetical protein [Saprospiraceae bacterium]